MSAPAREMTIREVLQLKPVRRLWLAQIVSVFGDFLAIFAVLSYVSFNLNATAAEVTGISVSFMIPFAVIGPVAGVFVDRWNVKRTMIASDLIRAALALGLVFTATLGQVYAILFLLSAVSAFFMPAQTVTLRTIVPLKVYWPQIPSSSRHSKSCASGARRLRALWSSGLGQALVTMSTASAILFRRP